MAKLLPAARIRLARKIFISACLTGGPFTKNYTTAYAASRHYLAFCGPQSPAPGVIMSHTNAGLLLSERCTLWRSLDDRAGSVTVVRSRTTSADIFRRRGAASASTDECRAAPCATASGEGHGFRCRTRAAEFSEQHHRRHRSRAGYHGSDRQPLVLYLALG